jgi:hypothetical protein
MSNETLSVTQLRMALADFQREGITEVDLLWFIKFLLQLIYEAKKNNTV